MLGVTQSEGGESQFKTSRRILSNLVDAAIDLTLCFGMITVACLRPNDVSELHAILGHLPGHDVGCLLLFVDFATIGHRWQMLEVLGIVGGVVEMPEFLLPPRRLYLFILKDIEKLGRLGETRPGGSGTPLFRKVNRKLPACGAAHAEAPHHQPLLIDPV